MKQSKNTKLFIKQSVKKVENTRDGFIDVFRANHLLISHKLLYHITTNNHHKFEKYQNLILDLQIPRLEQVWVSYQKRESLRYLSSVNKSFI